jgi:hypothetical protein
MSCREMNFSPARRPLKAVAGALEILAGKLHPDDRP